MRLALTILIVLLWAPSVVAQDLILQKADSLTTSSTARADSIRIAVQRNLGKADSLIANIGLQLRNAGTITPIDIYSPILKSFNEKADGINNTGKQITHLADSASGRLSVSLSEKVDSLNRLNPSVKIQEGKARVDETVQRTVNKPLSRVQGSIGSINQQAEGAGNLPVPEGGLGDGVLPGTDIRNIKTPELSSIQTRLPGVPDLPSINTGLVDSHTGIAGEFGDISEGAEKVSEYTSDLKTITSTNVTDVRHLDKDLMAKLPNDQLNAVQTELAAGSDQIEALKALKGEEAFRKKVVEKGREVVMEQIALQESRITDAVSKLSKHQRRAGTIFSRVRSFPKREREARPPDVIERLQPGFTLQVQPAEIWFVDLNPSLAFAIANTFRVGAGWNERLVIDRDYQFYESLRIYGIRTFYELSIRKGLWVRADVERMNTLVSDGGNSPDVMQRSFVWGYMLGLKKEFSLGRAVIGNVQFLYNLYDPEKESPYQSRFNVRFGFDLPLRKKNEITSGR